MRSNGYSIKPGTGIFLLFPLLPPPTMSCEFSFSSPWGPFSKMSLDSVFRFVQRTPSGKGIPWHRVIGERGKILIREPYASLQRKLLESEGVTILESRVDLKRHLWKPPVKSILKHKTRKKRIQK